jgi:hypothetical protein
MRKYIETKTERARRAYVEARQQHLDDSERYSAEMQAAGSAEGRAKIMAAFAQRRTDYRRAEVAAGKRPVGGGVTLHQIMWARWIEIAVDQELRAVQSFCRLRDGDLGELMTEFHCALLAVTASAYTIEAVFAEIKYLIPPPTQRSDRRDTVLINAFTQAFGIGSERMARIRAEMLWLFDRRDYAIHPYTEPEIPVPHPVGINSGKENAFFNAVTSGRAVDTAMTILDIAGNPPSPLNRWISRWVEDRKSYMTSVVLPLQARRTLAQAPVGPGGSNTSSSP